jgi:hypothetical protein
MDVQRADFMSTFTAAINGCNQSTHVKEHTPDLTIDPALLSLFPKRLPAAVTTVPLLSPQSTQATQLQSAGNKSTPWPLAPPAVWTTISLSPPQLSRATQLKLDGNPLMPGHLAPPAPPPAGTFLLQTIIGETSPQTGLVSDVRDAVECNPTPEKVRHSHA